jgi:hypothetical protein
MTWPDDISHDLPARRDDEPATLRHDIVDELADHLQCALNREVHFTSDEATAKQNVLERFGNPARVAYRLWFDAMKEKIMTQRMTMTAVIVLVAVCLFMGAMAWQIAQQNRETSLALLNQSRDMNTALLDKLAALAALKSEAKSMDWNPAKLRLVRGNENGPPAKGFKASLSSSSPPGPGKMPQVDRLSDENGMVDFGLVKYGDYSLMIWSSQEEWYSRGVTVEPGHEFSQTIVCPEVLKEGNVSFQINWPDDLKSAKLWLALTIIPVPRELAHWSNHAVKQIVVPNEGTELYAMTQAAAWNNIRASGGTTSGWNSMAVTQPVTLPARTWQLSRIVVLEGPRDGSAAQQYLSGVARPPAGFNFRVEPGAGSSSNAGFFGTSSGGFARPQVLGLDVERNERSLPVEPAGEPADVEGPKLEIKAGETTTWTIDIPAELANYLRDKLKDGTITPN